ncbi:hypothetical protein OHB54_04200 [Streptomyces sp. NBC_01007]|nr:hypothetical protein OHB54_04200 [Streptomyces sp. NBC_01007]
MISADDVPAFSMNALVGLDPQGEAALRMGAFAPASGTGPGVRPSLRSGGLAPTGKRPTAPVDWNCGGRQGMKSSHAPRRLGTANEFPRN